MNDKTRCAGMSSEGIGGVKQGLGLTFRPYGIVSGSKDYAEGTAAARAAENQTLILQCKCRRYQKLSGRLGQ